MKLSDKFSIFSGYAFKDFNTSQQGVPIIKIGNITADGRLNVDDVQYSTQTPNRKFYAQKGDFLIALSGATTGKSTIYSLKDNQYLVNQRVGIIRPITNNVRTELFFKYYLQYISHLVLHRAHGSAQPNISPKDLANFLLPCIDEKEQVEIGKLLSNIEAGIRVKQEQLKALDELIQSRFTEMFGNIKTKDKISNLCLINPTKPKNIDDDLLVSFLPMSNVSEQGNADLSIIRKYKEVKKGFTYFQDNDILFAKITPCMENGKGALVKNLKNHIGFGSTEFHVIRIQQSLVPQYLLTITQSKSFRSLAKEYMTGAVGQQRVPASFIENFSIPVPPLPLQNQFAEFVQQVEKAKEIVKIQIKDLQELLALKMDEYFK